MTVCIYRYINVIICFIHSMAVHPDRITIASGQVAGHDKREGRVSN